MDCPHRRATSHGAQRKAAASVRSRAAALLKATHGSPVVPSSSKRAVRQTTLESSALHGTSPAPKPKSRKRKVAADDDAPPEEKRARRFRAQPPQAFHDVFERALSQRFYVLQRCPGGTADCPEETFELAGSTGNVYKVQIARESSCDCPHALKGHQCKHVFYILSKVLHAPYNLVYQKALVSSELREIFAAASKTTPSGNASDGRRKAVEGDCPICYCELEAEGSEGLVWCRAACGQNFHGTCFETWARTKTGTSVMAWRSVHGIQGADGASCPTGGLCECCRSAGTLHFSRYEHIFKLGSLPLEPLF